MGWQYRKTLEGGIDAIPAEVLKMHEVVDQENDDWYTMHGVFDFCKHHVQRVLEDTAGYELQFAGLFVYLNKTQPTWAIQVRH